MQRIEFKNVIVQYKDVFALRNLSLNVDPGEFLALLGPSGCGKSTLLRVLGGFVPYEGSVSFDGQAVDDLPAHSREIGFVFQDYALFPHKTVRENIAFGLQMRKAARPTIDQRVNEMVALLRLDGLADRYPSQLSGGQQQRVALARAIAINPRVLLLDEPLGALDKKLREEMQVELRQLQQRVGITTIFVTHDQEEALSLADRIAVMSGGEIRQIGPKAEIYERPANRFVAEFMGQSNIVPASVIAFRDGVWRCRLASGDIIDAAAGADLAVGKEVFLLVRSERMKLLDGSALPADGLSAEERLPGTVDHVTYLGSQIQVRVRLVTGDVFKIFVHNTGAASFSLKAGDPATLSFSADDVIVLAA